jgi:hypothetical protein
MAEYAIQYQCYFLMMILVKLLIDANTQYKGCVVNNTIKFIELELHIDILQTSIDHKSPRGILFREQKYMKTD